MKISKFLYFIFLAFVISACGFKPMLASKNNETASMKNIKIGKIEAKNPIKVERLLEEIFHNEDQSEVLYRLDIEIKNSTESQAIQKDGVTSRYRVRIDLKYNLHDISSNNIIGSGKLYLYGSYNVAYSDFMNYMSERYVNENLLRDLLNDLKSRLSLVLISEDKLK
jgi:hypothetical protein